MYVCVCFVLFLLYKQFIYCKKLGFLFSEKEKKQFTHLECSRILQNAILTTHFLICSKIKVSFENWLCLFEERINCAGSGKLMGNTQLLVILRVDTLISVD